MKGEVFNSGIIRVGDYGIFNGANVYLILLNITFLNVNKGMHQMKKVRGRPAPCLPCSVPHTCDWPEYKASENIPY